MEGEGEGEGGSGHLCNAGIFIVSFSTQVAKQKF